ncbi:MAG: hypothetical protein NUW37_00250 [Planctomycetes bacterium]|nr:hypothetical protein [Planctomycetota bacterium]
MVRCALTSFLPLLFLCSGCATIFSGSDREVRFESQIQGAQVQVDGGQWWPTPTTITLDTGNTHSVTFQHPGGQTSTATVNQHFNPVALFNLIGLIPWVVDLLTGAVWKLDKVVTDPAIPTGGYGAGGGGGYGPAGGGYTQSPGYGGPGQTGRQSGW